METHCITFLNQLSIETQCIAFLNQLSIDNSHSFHRQMNDFREEICDHEMRE